MILYEYFRRFMVGTKISISLNKLIYCYCHPFPALYCVDIVGGVQ